jgi:hypothetical protein
MRDAKRAAQIAARWRANHPEQAAEVDQAAKRKRKYGLTREGYAWMLEQQGGACALCDAAPTCVDHDHEDGHTRALVCKGCNTKIGMLEANRIIAKRALNYVSAHALA